ncbi:MAG: CehA/McbA family metallohydrolase [Kofleriaceae bacterium]
MTRRLALASAVLAACGADLAPGRPQPPAAVIDARLVDAAPLADAAPLPVEWLRGSTHVHALPSGDSKTPIPEVIAWYEANGYDFIVLTDHNRVSEVDGATAGQPAVRWPKNDGLIVLAGSELTYNSTTCDPPPPAPDGKCRLHVNALGVTARPVDKLVWADPTDPTRLGQYGRAIELARALGGLVQLNHPTWHWGTTPGLLVDLVGRGVQLVEIANKQFASWNAGAEGQLSAEALWDAALAAGATVWGVASDDAHDYVPEGTYPAGGAYVVVRAQRTPTAIVAALAAGEFYASTGVALARVEVEAGALVVEVAADEPGPHLIRYVHDGQVVAELAGRLGAYPIPRTGSLRAVVERPDGARAWVQPVRP